MIRIEEQIEEVEHIIRALKSLPTFSETAEHNRRIAVLGAIAAGLRARLDTAPSVALHELERRLLSVERSKCSLGYSQGSLTGVAQELIGRWPVVRAALEKFGAMIESGDDPVEVGFRIGFEHAVEGGHDAGRLIPSLRGTEPLVLYFEDEDGRREMIDAIHHFKPGMVEAKIPQRRAK